MWKNKIYIGRGTLETFKRDYDEINDDPKLKCTASQLFQTETVNVSQGDTLSEVGFYEFAIYYVEQIQEEEPTQEPKTQVQIKSEIKPSIAEMME